MFAGTLLKMYVRVSFFFFCLMRSCHDRRGGCGGRAYWVWPPFSFDMFYTAAVVGSWGSAVFLQVHLIEYLVQVKKHSYLSKHVFAGLRMHIAYPDHLTQRGCPQSSLPMSPGGVVWAVCFRTQRFQSPQVSAHSVLCTCARF